MMMADESARLGGGRREKETWTWAGQMVGEGMSWTGDLAGATGTQVVHPVFPVYRGLLLRREAMMDDGTSNHRMQLQL
jgi:hypothetical protein